MNVAALLFLDGTPLLDEEGELRLTVVRELIERRLQARPAAPSGALTPLPRGPGRPVWVDVPRVDVAAHVRPAVRIPAPGDEAAVLAECARLNAAVLPRSRPLLVAVVVDGPGGRSPRRAGPLAPRRRGRRRRPRLDRCVLRGPGRRQSPGSPGSGRWSQPAGGRGQLAGAARLVMGRTLAAVDLVRMGRAPRLSINRPARAAVRLVLVRGDLERARAAAHTRGGTVNDVVLTAVAGGARAVLATRGELERAPVLHVSLAASIRRPGEPLVGNRVGIGVVPVPLSEADPVRRLEKVARITRRWRSGGLRCSPAGRSCSAGWSPS